MKYEFQGWAQGLEDPLELTGPYHGIVLNDNQNRESACGAPVVSYTEKAIPEGKKVCPKCDELVPQFACIEYSTGFAVRHTRTGQEHWMSDGVDALFDENDKALSPGSPGFREKWEDALNESGSETLEAYFPDLYEQENAE